MPRKRETPDRVEDSWLALHREGLTYRGIATLANRSVKAIWAGIWRARQREGLRSTAGVKPSPRYPRLTPIYPIGGLFPGSPCPHNGPIPRGSVCYCEQCSASGVDHYRVFTIESGEMPPPERRPEPKSGKKTRRERRKSA